MAKHRVAGLRRQASSADVDTKSRGSADLIAFAAAAPVIIGITQVAVFSDGRPSVMAAILSSTNVVALFGTSFIQYIPIALSYFLATITLSKAARKWLVANIAKRPWLFILAPAVAYIVILATSWLFVLVAAFFFICMLLWVGFSYLLLRGILKVQPRITQLQTWAEQRIGSLRASRGNAKRPAARSAKVFSGPSGTTLARSTGKPLKMSDMADGAISSPRTIVLMLGIAAMVPIVALPVSFAPLEEVRYDQTDTTVGYVVSSDETWTTMVAHDRTIKVIKTSEVVSRRVCPSIHASIPMLRNGRAVIVNEVDAIITRLFDPEFISRPHSCG